ncbi:hypothetical protein GDO86_015853 [Hymenochirus boettgeri]|uniref:YLP motif-containing protein 1 n=1 Tax=Hymenochirus boettgeri TaxID=247094 RepID=A0A8T2K2R9_9PIPI|nr:hypothetical protein GDO86_015853 [Hymenochirus boettgeri]
MYPSWGRYGGSSSFSAPPAAPPPAPPSAPPSGAFQSFRDQHLAQLQQLQKMHQRQLETVLPVGSGAQPPTAFIPQQGNFPAAGSSYAKRSYYGPEQSYPYPPLPYGSNLPPPGYPAYPPPQTHDPQQVNPPPPEPVPPPEPAPPPEPSQPPPPPEPEQPPQPMDTSSTETSTEADSLSLEQQQHYWYKQHLLSLQQKAKLHQKENHSTNSLLSSSQTQERGPAPPATELLPAPPVNKSPPPLPVDVKPNINPPEDPAQAERLKTLQEAAAHWQQHEQHRLGFQYQGIMQKHATLQQLLQRYQQISQQPPHLAAMTVEMQLQHYEMQQKQFPSFYQEWETQFKKWQELLQTYPHKDQLKEYDVQWKSWQTQIKTTKTFLKERISSLKSMQQQYGGNHYIGGVPIIPSYPTYPQVMPSSVPPSLTVGVSMPPPFSASASSPFSGVPPPLPTVVPPPFSESHPPLPPMTAIPYTEPPPPLPPGNGVSFSEAQPPPPPMASTESATQPPLPPVTTTYVEIPALSPTTVSTSSLGTLSTSVVSTSLQSSKYDSGPPLPPRTNAFETCSISPTLLSTVSNMLLSKKLANSLPLSDEKAQISSTQGNQPGDILKSPSETKTSSVSPGFWAHDKQAIPSEDGNISAVRPQFSLSERSSVAPPPPHQIIGVMNFDKTKEPRFTSQSNVFPSISQSQISDSQRTSDFSATTVALEKNAMMSEDNSGQQKAEVDLLANQSQTWKKGREQESQMTDAVAPSSDFNRPIKPATAATFNTFRSMENQNIEGLQSSLNPRTWERKPIEAERDVDFSQRRFDGSLGAPENLKGELPPERPEQSTEMKREWEKQMSSQNNNWVGPEIQLRDKWGRQNVGHSDRWGAPGDMAKERFGVNEGPIKSRWDGSEGRPMGILDEGPRPIWKKPEFPTVEKCGRSEEQPSERLDSFKGPQGGRVTAFSNDRPEGPPGDRWGRPEGPPGDRWGRPEGPPGDRWGRPEGPPGDRWGRPKGPPGDRWESLEGPPGDRWGRPDDTCADQWGKQENERKGGLDDDEWNRHETTISDRWAKVEGQFEDKQSTPEGSVRQRWSKGDERSSERWVLSEDHKPPEDKEGRGPFDSKRADDTGFVSYQSRFRNLNQKMSDLGKGHLATSSNDSLKGENKKIEERSKMKESKTCQLSGVTAPLIQEHSKTDHFTVSKGLEKDANVGTGHNLVSASTDHSASSEVTPTQNKVYNVPRVAEQEKSTVLNSIKSDESSTTYENKPSVSLANSGKIDVLPAHGKALDTPLALDGENKSSVCTAKQREIDINAGKLNVFPHLGKDGIEAVGEASVSEKSFSAPGQNLAQLHNEIGRQNMSESSSHLKTGDTIEPKHSKTGAPPAPVQPRSGAPPAPVQPRSGAPPAPVQPRSGAPPAPVQPRANTPGIFRSRVPQGPTRLGTPGPFRGGMPGPFRASSPSVLGQPRVGGPISFRAGGPGYPRISGPNFSADASEIEGFETKLLHAEQDFDGSPLQPKREPPFPGKEILETGSSIHSMVKDDHPVPSARVPPNVAVEFRAKQFRKETPDNENVQEPSFVDPHLKQGPPGFSTQGGIREHLIPSSEQRFSHGQRVENYEIGFDPRGRGRGRGRLRERIPPRPENCDVTEVLRERDLGPRHHFMDERPHFVEGPHYELPFIRERLLRDHRLPEDDRIPLDHLMEIRRRELDRLRHDDWERDRFLRDPDPIFLRDPMQVLPRDERLFHQLPPLPRELDVRREPWLDRFPERELYRGPGGVLERFERPFEGIDRERDYHRMPNDIDFLLRDRIGGHPLRRPLSPHRPLSPVRPCSPLRTFPPLPALPPIERYLEDRWKEGREPVIERDLPKPGEFRIREYPERSEMWQERNANDDPWYPPQNRIQEGLEPSQIAPMSLENPDMEGGIQDVLTAQPSPAVLALSQRQHEIILKAAQELKMLREQKEQLDNLKNFFNEPQTSIDSQHHSALLEEPDTLAPNICQAPSNKVENSTAQVRPPRPKSDCWNEDSFSGLWDDERRFQAQAVLADSGKPGSLSLGPKGAQQTVDYAHGRDLSVGKVEQTPYGERVVLLPDSALERAKAHKDYLNDRYDRDLRDREPYYERQGNKNDRRELERDRDSHRDRGTGDHERERFDRDRHSREDRSTSYRDSKESSSRRGGSDKTFERKSERPSYDLTQPAFGGERRGYAEERQSMHPSLPAPKVEKKPEIKNVDDLLKKPGRDSRPDRIVVIMRGLPGSGKTHVAKLIRDKEVECGGAAPRVLSLDDYFITEVEKLERDPDSGKKIKKKVMEYEYEPDMEETYRSSMFKTFKKTLDDGFFPFIILDSINDRVRHFEHFWSAAKTKGFEVYLAEMSADTQICAKRNVHGRKLKEINKISDHWDAAPRHMIRLDVRSLLQDAAIEEVEMEDSEPAAEAQGEIKPEPSEEEESDRVYLSKSKWEMDTSEAKLDKLDGLKGSKRKRGWESGSSRLEDYLQLPDDYDTRESEPGKKRVRWADLEEKKDADRKRAIGFVVGQTDWDKITDKSGHLAERALNRTKYI